MVVEGVSQGKYHFVGRWCATDYNPKKRGLVNFDALCKFLVDKSKISARPTNKGRTGFANKKYETDFYVEARKDSAGIYHLRDFKLHLDSQDSPRHNYYSRPKRELSPRMNLSQSEHDWAFAKRALACGEDPKEVVEQIAKHRAADNPTPCITRASPSRSRTMAVEVHRGGGH
jgi:hypothetical protein